MTANPANWLVTMVLGRKRRCVLCGATDDVRAMVRLRTWPLARYAHKDCLTASERREP